MDININDIANALKNSLDPSETVRASSEDFFRKCKTLEAFGPFLLKISTDEQYIKEVRLNAAIQLKNYIQSYWKYGDNSQINECLKFEADEMIIVIKDSDKSVIRKNIIQLTTTCSDKIILKHYNQVIQKIIRYDFRDKNWPELIPTISKLLSTESDKSVLAGVNAILQIGKIFEFENKDYKKPYIEALKIFFPALTKIMAQILPNFKIPEAAAIVKKVMNVYVTSIKIEFPRFFIEDKAFEAWISYFFHIMAFDLPPELKTLTNDTAAIEKLSKNLYWKTKIITMNVLFMIYRKFGHEDKHSDYPAFNILIRDKYSKNLLNMNLVILSNSLKTFTPNQIVCLSYKFFSQFINKDQLVGELKNFIPQILDHMIQESLLTKVDIENFLNEPKTFIYHQSDEITESYFIKRYAICQFIKSLVTYKQKNNKGRTPRKARPDFYDQLMKYFINILELYEAEVQKQSNPNYLIKESVLNILQNISDTIIKYSEGVDIETIMKKYIFYELSSSNGIMKERACSFIHSFKNFIFQTQELQNEIARKICELTEDSNLPVRVRASVTLPNMLENKTIKNMLVPHISTILNVYLKLMSEIDLEELINGLEYLVRFFGKDIVAYSRELFNELHKAFVRMVQTQVENDEGAAQLAAGGVLKTMDKLLEISSNTEVFSHLVDKVSEVVKWGFTPLAWEMQDDIFELMLTIVKYHNTIVPRMWEFFPDLLETVLGNEEDIMKFQKEFPGQTFEGSGYESLHEITQIISYMIVKDQNTFLNGADSKGSKFIETTLKFIKENLRLTTEKEDLITKFDIIQLISIMLETLTDKINNYFEIIMVILTEEFFRNDKQSVKISVVQNFCLCLTYNSSVTLNFLDKSGNLKAIFDFWFTNLNNNLRYDYQYKINIMGIASILLAKTAELPQMVKDHFKYIIDKLIETSKKNIENKQKLATSLGTQTTKGGTNLNLDEDYEDEEEDDFIKNRELAEKNLEAEEDELFGSFSDDDYEDLISEKKIQTPISTVNEFTYLKNVFNQVYNDDKTYYGQIISCLNPDQQSVLKLIFDGLGST